MPTTKDLLNNSTIVALIPTEELAIAVETGAITDLQGMGRKVLVVVNAGTPGAGGLLNIVVQESNVATMVVGTPGAIDGAIDATQKYIDLHAGEGVNWPSLDEFSFTIDTETFICTKRVVDRLYVKRAQYGTTAAIHVNDSVLVLYIATLHTFAEIDAASLVEADLAPNKRYIRIVATVTVGVFLTGITGIVYLEREIPSGV